MAAEQRLSPTDRANLVAYLDGELSDSEARGMATKLTKSATARREVEILERTWELLDYLPRPQASELLTARTMSGVLQLSLQGDKLDSAARTAARRAVWAVVWMIASCLAFGVGYAVTVWAWPDPTARLSRDLPIAEHLDEYRDVATPEYLESLATSPEFSTARD